MPRVYATPADLTAWTGKAAPADAERQLARASEDVDSALLTAVYRTDADGMPTDPDVTAALRDAVCALVEYRAETGDSGTGARDQWDSVSLGPASMSGRRTTGGRPGGVDLGDRAERALRRAGLLPGVVC
ncbi:head-tail connector protein [Streptomyces longwoodensis]|uniref:hypothetical protein n=1 Tax=Streptomyces longwoodensis TaxID=68231 RepID=UPI0036FB4F0F